LAALAAPVSALEYHYWFWTTASDPTPLGFDECVRRAPAALATQGFTAGRTGSNPVNFDATNGTASVTMACIGQPHGFYMTLVVMSDDPSRTSLNVGNAINSAFWGTNASPAAGGATGGATGGNWRLSSNCAWVPGNFASTLSLNLAGGGALSGSVTSDNLGAGGIDLLPDSSGSWNGSPPPMRSQVGGSTVTIVLHPKSWVSIVELTGQLNGNQISGKVHHYTNDDCTFTMTRA
jgi:hypothetical protein